MTTPTTPSGTRITAREDGCRQNVPPDHEYLCPNCVTPWKCNGPHIPESDPPGEQCWTVGLDDIKRLEAKAKEQGATAERERLRARLGGDGWLRLPDGRSATVVHIIMDDCECSGFGCELDPGTL